MIKTRSEQFKNLLEILIIALLVIIAFFWTTKSYAYTIASQINQDGSTNTGTQSQSLGVLHGELTTVTIYMQRTSATSSEGVQIRDMANNVLACNTSSTYQTVSATTTNFTFNMVNCPGAVEGTTPFNFNNATATKLIFGSTNLFTKGSISDLYPNGSCLLNCNTVSDDFFIINGSGTIPSAISITTPTNGTSTRDFPNWIVSASGNISTIQINYTDNFSSYNDFTTFNINTNGFVSLPITKHHTLSVSTSSFYSATPYILDTNGIIIATGTTIFFQINNTLNNISTSTTFAQNFAQYVDNVNNNIRKIPFGSSDTCNPFSLFSCFIDAMTFLGDTFIFPHQGSMDVLNSAMQNYTCTDVNTGNLLTNCTGIFPFNVFFSFANQAKNVASSTYGAEQNFNIPLTGLGSANSITLFSSTSVNNTIGSSTKTTYFSYANSIMYFLTGYKILTTILL